MNSRDPVCVGIVLLGALLNFFPRRSGPIDMRWDAAKYYVLGTSLAIGHGYRELSEPGEIEEIQYPPGTPALIALHEAVAGTTEPAKVGPWLKLSWFLMYTGLCLLTYVLVREIAPPWLAALGALLVTFNVPLYFQSAQCSSEVPFAILSSGFILVARRGNSKRAELAAALLVVAAYFVRTVGVALLAAWIIDGLTHGLYRRAALRLGLAAACILAWNVRVRRVESSDAFLHPAYTYQTAGYQFYNVSYGRNMAYIDPFQPELGMAGRGQLVKRFLSNAVLVPKVIGDSVSLPVAFWSFAVWKLHQHYRTFPSVPDVVFSLLNAAWGLVVIAGMAILFLRGESLIAASVALTLAAIAASPWPEQMSRYIAPLAPLLVFALFVFGLKTMSRIQLGLMAGGIVLGQALLYLLILHTYSVPTRLGAPGEKPVEVRHLFFDRVNLSIEEGLDWIAAHSRPDDIIAMTSPHVGFLRTGRKTVMPPLQADHARANSLLKEVPIRYLLLERNQATFIWKYMWPVVSGYPADWNLVFRSPGDLVLVYEYTARPTVAAH